MMEIKRLDKTYQNDFENMNCVIREGLVHKDWFMPLPDEIIRTLFEPDSAFVVYGCEVDGVLAGVSLLDHTEEEFAPLAKEAGVSPSMKGAELGVSMVLPAYRGQNLMLKIDSALIEVAKEEGLDYVVATAHPDNIASNKSLQKAGMQYVSTIMREGKYKRNVYYLPL